LLKKHRGKQHKFYNERVSAAVRFYQGEPNSSGDRIDEIWSWPVDRLESCHDYIQWLFPTREPSAFNSHAPLLDPETVEAFRTNPDLRDRMRRSLSVMLAFYGFERDQSGKIIRGPDFARLSALWLTVHNHNHFRLTRILKSLRALGLEDEARALFEALEAVYCGTNGRISAVTFGFWKDAMR
jgi:hypothetical protein